jgi:signal transduction histidine kinase
VFVNLIVNAADAITHKSGAIQIKTELVSLALHGTQPIRKATCPKNHSLLDNETKIGGLPAIKLKAGLKDRTGVIHLDPIYGRNRNQYGIIYSGSEMLQLHCPECNLSLVDDDTQCPVCDALLYNLVIPGSGLLTGCTRIGCDWQKWDAIDAIGTIRHVVITVTDNGCGIPDSEIDKIFDPFYSTKGQKGTGLGLSIIWGIVDNHGGTISVKSTQQKGTRFILRLPVEQIL